MKEDSGAVRGEVTIAPGVGLEQLDDPLRSLRRGVDDAVFRIDEQPRQVALYS